MKHRRLTYMLVVTFLILALGACGQPATPTMEPPATEPPATEPPATEAPITPSPPNVAVVLPADAVQRLNNAADQLGYSWTDLASDHTVFYALPESGIAFLLTPASAGPKGTADELKMSAENQKLDTTQILGGLTVILDGITELPTGDYIITLASDGKTVEFHKSPDTTASFEAVIRTLPRSLPPDRPVALITSSQMCLTWETTQVCALISTPLPTGLSTILTEAIRQLADQFTELGIEQEDFNFERAIPDTEGFEMIQQCAEALSAKPPAYDQCLATILTAPTFTKGAFDAPPEVPGTIQGLDVLVVLQDMHDQLFQDPELGTLSTTPLFAGKYLTYEVLLPGENPTEKEPIHTRVRLYGLTDTGPANFYLPALSGGVIIGEVLIGNPSAPSNSEEAIIANRWTNGCCSGWRWWQCPWW